MSAHSLKCATFFCRAAMTLTSWSHPYRGASLGGDFASTARVNPTNMMLQREMLR